MVAAAFHWPPSELNKLSEADLEFWAANGKALLKQKGF